MIRPSKFRFPDKTAETAKSFSLIAFEIAYKQCDCIVAHNMEFDIEIILAEIERNRTEILSRAPQCFTLFQPVYERVSNIERYCTMRKGTNICNIAIPSKTEGKPPRKKWPKLSELHSHLFNGEQAKGLHNSFIDVMICLKCYLKMTAGKPTVSPATPSLLFLYAIRNSKRVRHS